MNRSRAKLVRDTLEIPYKRRRRARLGVLMKMLKSIHGTANTERNVEMFLKRGQYPDAVRIVREVNPSKNMIKTQTPIHNNRYVH